MPRKPTQPFGHIAFSKESKVTTNMTLLPDDKEGQEVGVVTCAFMCDDTGTATINADELISVKVTETGTDNTAVGGQGSVTLIFEQDP